MGAHACPWAPRQGRELSQEELREARANLAGFFTVLRQWAKDVRASDQKEHAHRASGVGPQPSPSGDGTVRGGIDALASTKEVNTPTSKLFPVPQK